MTDKIMLRGAMSGMALAAAAAALMGPGPMADLNRSQKRKRVTVTYRRAADRSKKQYLLKGIRP